jgi:hypothetical protein
LSYNKRLLAPLTRKFGFIDDPKSFDVMVLNIKQQVYAYRIYVYAVLMLKTEDLQKQHEILNEVAV